MNAKNTPEIAKRGFFTIALVLFFSASLPTHAIEVGKFAYKGALEDFNVDTIIVSDTMIALSNKIFAKTDFSVGNDSINDTPSIFFIIDHSGSMSYCNSGDPINDRWGNRFVVSAQFIDALAKKIPAAKVGVAVFQDELWYNATDNPNLVTLPSYPTLGAYVPLLQLNTIYGGASGLDLLKQFLATDTATSTRQNKCPSIKYADLVYGSHNGNSGSTCINIGFEAAKDAFSKEPVTADMKRKQYIIFLSDGASNTNGPGNLTQTYYEQGVNVPTTFTVFFTSTGTVPATINTMTTNIRSNGYSTKNDSSRYWAYNNTSADSLMSFLMTNIFGMINTSIPGNPAQITIGSQTSTTWSAVDSAFLFPNLFPLTGTVTPFTATIKYRFSNGDTSHTVNFSVMREPLYKITPPSKYEVGYWDRNLNLRFNGARTTVITETMDSLELVFDYAPGTAPYNYSNVKVQVFNQLGAIKDNETYNLIKKGADTFSIKFMRAVSSTPVPGNRIFEHQGVAGDSLIAVFRNSENPMLPLDTLRIAIPINLSPPATLTTAITGDLDGDGYIDHIELVFNKDVALTDVLKNGFRVKGNGTVFPIDSISKINNSTYLLCLHEVKTSLPQTSWTPQVSISSVPLIQSVDTFHTSDGCPPVVWHVQKYIADSLRTDDTVKIVFSEKITGKTGAPFNTGTSPSNVFHVWVKDGTSFALADTMFTGIPSFMKFDNDSILIFTMSNGKDLTSANYINIRYEDSLVRDRAGNFPTVVNQRVPVTIDAVAFHITTGPNPARPTQMHSEPMQFEDNPNAVTWARQGQGTYISLTNLTRPSNPDDASNVSGNLQIMDVVGNTVDWCNTKDIFGNPKNSVQFIHIYWNGLNHRGMAVAPGVYRVVVMVNYPGSAKIPNSKSAIKIGIK